MRNKLISYGVALTLGVMFAGPGLSSHAQNYSRTLCGYGVITELAVNVEKNSVSPAANDTTNIAFRTSNRADGQIYGIINDSSGWIVIASSQSAGDRLENMLSAVKSAYYSGSMIRMDTTGNNCVTAANEATLFICATDSSTVCRPNS